MLRYNAECDAAVPKSVAEIIRELEAEERSRGHAAARAPSSSGVPAASAGRAAAPPSAPEDANATYRTHPYSAPSLHNDQLG